MNEPEKEAMRALQAEQQSLTRSWSPKEEKRILAARARAVAEAAQRLAALLEAEAEILEREEHE